MGNVQGAAPQPNMPNNGGLKFDSQLFQKAVTLLTDIMTNTTEEVSHLGALGLKGSGKQQEGNKPTLQELAPNDPRLAMAAQSSIMDEVEDIKKAKNRKKEAELEEKLKELLSFIEGFDLSELQDEERQKIEAFVKKAKTIFSLKNQLSYLEEKEETLTRIIKKAQENSPEN